MKVKLKLENRIVLGSCLPKEGNFKEIVIREQIVEKVKVTAKETEEFEIKPINKEMMGWNQKGADHILEVNFTEIEIEEIKATLQKLNDSKKLSGETVALCKIFKLSF